MTGSGPATAEPAHGPTGPAHGPTGPAHGTGPPGPARGPDAGRRPDGYQLRPGPVPAELAHRWLSTDAYWAIGRDLETVRRSLTASLVYGLYAPSGDPVGLARAVTDGATFAWLADVYVLPAHRGRGLGCWLVGTLTDRLRANGVSRLLLATRDAHGVYAPLGWSPLAHPEWFMEIDTRISPGQSR